MEREGIAQKKGSDNFTAFNPSLCLSTVLHKCVRKLHNTRGEKIRKLFGRTSVWYQHLHRTGNS